MVLTSFFTAVGAAAEIYKASKEFGDSDISGEEYLKRGSELIWKKNGSMLELIADTIVEPTIIVSKDLRESESIDDVINVNVNMFSSFYMQAFNFAVGLGNQDPMVTLSLLSSGRLKYSTEDDVLSLDGEVVKLNSDVSFLPIKKETISLEADEKGWSTKTTKNEKKTSAKFSKDDVLPLTLTKTIELTIDTTNTVDTSHASNKVKTSEGKITRIVIPITIRANIIYTDFDNILNMVAPNGSGTSFYERFLEWRSGGIEFWRDLVFAQDLIEKYQDNKIKDHDDLIKLMNDRKYDSNAKLMKEGTKGKGAYHATIIINKDQLDRLNQSLGAKVSKDPEKLFNATSTIIFTTIDEDYDRANFFVKDIGSRSDVKLKTLKKNKGGDDDLNGIFKSLLSNKPISF